MRFRAFTFLTLALSGLAHGNKITTTTSSPAVLTLRVASYNTHYGTEKRKILENIRSVHPDIVLLQETPLENLKHFSKVLKMTYQFVPYRAGINFGLGIMTVGKIVPVKPFTMPGEHNFALASKVTLAGREILVVGAHFKSLPRPLVSGVFKTMGPHLEQAKAIVDLVKKTTLPAIVGGDLNTLAVTPAYLTLSLTLKDTAVAAGTTSQPSIFVGGEGYRIDYLFVRGPWKIIASRVSPLPGSDHRLIWTDLQLPLK